MPKSNYFDYNSFLQSNHYLQRMEFKDNFGKYTLSVKTGAYIKFDITPTNHPHVHNSYYEICFVISGKGKFIHGDDTFTLEKGTVFLADPNIVHEITSFETRDLYLIFFSYKIDDTKISLSKKPEDIIIHNFEKSHNNVSVNQNILFHYLPLISHIPLCNNALKALILEFLYALTKKPASAFIEQTLINRNLALAVKIINNNIHKKICVKDLAAQLYISERNLRYLFRKYYNKSIIEYINDKKLDFASQKILMGFRISEAAQSIGINDTSQFSRMFKKKFGISPKSYQSKYSL